jgi:MinD-like ATPase involved in chromosome partitioning or flagellar assembly
MDKISVIVADADERYTGMLASFVRSGEYSNQFSLTCFTHPEALSLVIQQTGRRWSLYVVHESLAASFAPVIGEGEIVLLCEQVASLEGGIDKRIAKFQPLNQFFAKLKSFCAQSSGLPGARLRDSERCRVSAIYSSAGGAGKTTVAVNLAVHLAKRGKKVFLLNLEPFPSLSSFIAFAEGGGLSRFLYYLRSQHRDLAEKLEQCKTYDPALKWSCFAPPDNLLDLEEMSEGDVSDIIRCIRRSGIYDELVIDMDSAFHRRNLGALGECDRICWLVVDDVYGRMKTGQSIRRLQQYENQAGVSVVGKVSFWQNKSVDMHKGDFGDGIPIEGVLPYVPEWKSASVNPRWLFDSLRFNESLAGLAAEEEARGVNVYERRMGEEIQRGSDRSAGLVGPSFG